MIEMTDLRRKQLDEIVDLMNKEAELKLLYDEESEESKHAEEVLRRLKGFADKLEEHERTYLETGLMDHKDIHDVYWPNAGGRGKHQREKYARLDSEGKTSGH